MTSTKLLRSRVRLQASSTVLKTSGVGDCSAEFNPLKASAPVIAVRGNNDHGSWAEAISAHNTVTIGTVSLYLLHILKDLPINPKNAGIHVVISGHSHKPLVEELNGVLSLNPGSAGPRRFKLPIALAHLYLDGTSVQAKIVELAT